MTATTRSDVSARPFPATDGTPRALSWRVIRDASRPGATNMAFDHALAAELGDDEAVLRLYSWGRPTVSFGRNEPARGLYSLPAARSRGVDYVRRPTGGRAVLHAAELTYAVVAPIRSLGGVREAYARINAALAAALSSLGAAVALSQEADSLPVDAGPCFRTPAEGEVTADGRKLVGSAQARVGGALLQHGSIILAGDQSLLTVLRERHEDEEEHEAPATLTSLVGGVDAADVADAVTDHLRGRFGGRWTTSRYRTRELQSAARLEAERYGRDEWTWRR